MINQNYNPSHMAPTKRLARVLALTILISSWFALGGCRQAVKWENPATAAQQSGKQTKQRHSRGNPPFYEVFGQRYYVMTSNSGFKERGVASWYGKKFHGKPTSSGVIYDMYAMTAAHKTLPLPTKLRVRNLRNGRSIIVTVNDRGPFIDNRIIDLSYAAANRLDIVKDGTALVEISVIPTPGIAAPAATVAETQPAKLPAANLYLQVGAFGDQTNAQQLLNRLHGRGFQNAIIRSDTATASPIFRVRLGPINDVAEYDALVEKMAALEIIETHLVSEQPALSGT